MILLTIKDQKYSMHTSKINIGISFCLLFQFSWRYNFCIKEQAPESLLMLYWLFWHVSTEARDKFVLFFQQWMLAIHQNWCVLSARKSSRYKDFSTVTWSATQTSKDTFAPSVLKDSMIHSIWKGTQEPTQVIKSYVYFLCHCRNVSNSKTWNFIVS